MNSKYETLHLSTDDTLTLTYWSAWSKSKISNIKKSNNSNLNISTEKFSDRSDRVNVFSV